MLFTSCRFWTGTQETTPKRPGGFCSSSKLSILLCEDVRVPRRLSHRQRWGDRIIYWSLLTSSGADQRNLATSGCVRLLRGPEHQTVGCEFSSAGRTDECNCHLSLACGRQFSVDSSQYWRSAVDRDLSIAA